MTRAGGLLGSASRLSVQCTTVGAAITPSNAVAQTNLANTPGSTQTGWDIDTLVRIRITMNSLTRPHASHGVAGFRRVAGRNAVTARRFTLCRQQAAAVEVATADPCVEELESPTPGHLGTDGVMLQGFHWESHKTHPWYNTIKYKIPEIQGAGFTHIWLPPPSQSVSPEGYMPGQLYNLSSAYGNEQQLVELNEALKAAGIAPLADIVINHRCADSQDEHGRWNNYHDDHDHDGLSIDWGQWAITCDDHEFGGQGNKDTGDDFWGAPDLDHTNSHLREALTHWMQHLRDNVGFTGWRFDFARGYGAQYIQEYVDGSGTKDDLNVGEVWTDLHWDGCKLGTNQDDARQRICNWIDGTQRRSTAFDFVTKGVLQEAVKHCEYFRLADSKNKAPGLIGWWPQRAVTFVDNHDTGSTQRHWPFPSDRVSQGYAYILTHPGMPCVAFDHYFDWGSKLRGEINALMQARRDAGIVAKSKLEIHCAEGDMYVGRITGTKGSLVLKLGPRYDMGALLPKQEDGWSKAAVGKDYCVWIKQNDEEVAAIPEQQ